MLLHATASSVSSRVFSAVLLACNASACHFSACLPRLVPRAFAPCTELTRRFQKRGKRRSWIFCCRCDTVSWSTHPPTPYPVLRLALGAYQIYHPVKRNFSAALETRGPTTGRPAALPEHALQKGCELADGASFSEVNGGKGIL